MPRPGVDDLEGGVKIASPSAEYGLTTCTTHEVAPQLVLTGLLLLFFNFFIIFFLLTKLDLDVLRPHMTGALTLPQLVTVELLLLPIDTNRTDKNCKPGYGLNGGF